MRCNPNVMWLFLVLEDEIRLLCLLVCVLSQAEASVTTAATPWEALGLTVSRPLLVHALPYSTLDPVTSV